MANSLAVDILGKEGVLSFTEDTFSVSPAASSGNKTRKATLQTSLKNVLWAEMDETRSSIRVATLAIKKGRLRLVPILGKVKDAARAQEWIDALMGLAYKGVQPQRKLKVLINPAGGPGKAKRIFESILKPILDAAHCTLDVEYTTKRFHARDIASVLPLTYDAIATLSGDGLLHEVINGLALQKDAVKALSIPVVPVPTGSANGFNVNLIGAKLAFDIPTAALNLIKGKPLALDLCSVTQGTTRTWSFFSQTSGLMADLDLGTENMRWMGDTRFIVGFLKYIISPRPCPITLSMKVVSDKEAILRDAREKAGSQALSSFEPLSPLDEVPQNVDLGLPSDRYAGEKVGEDGWVTFEKPILYVYGGLAPYVARDLLQFPFAEPSDGLIDVVVQEMVSRPILLGALDGSEKGMQFWLPSQNYYKALALRITPSPASSKSQRDLLDIDGEAYPWAEMYVEAHKGLARTLSLHGAFIKDFDVNGKTKK